MPALDGRVEEIVEVVDVHVAIAETPPGRNVEIAYYFVDSDDSFDPTSFVALLVQSRPVAFALALLDSFTTAECPAVGCVCFAHFVACIAAPWFFGVRRCRR